VVEKALSQANDESFGIIDTAGGNTPDPLTY
jgi:hypothetical protein